MPTQIATGSSSASDPVEALKEAAIAVKTRLNAVRTDLVIVFATGGLATPESLAAVKRILQPKHLIGAATPGVIVAEETLMHGVGILGIISDEIHFTTSFMDKLSSHPLREDGLSFARQLIKSHEPHPRNACLFMYDGLRKNAFPFCAGMREGLGLALPMAGAIGAESTKLASAPCFFDTSVMQDAAVGLIVGGAGAVAMASRHSWQPLGKPRIIDASRGNLILSIDKRPAVSLYENYFKEGETKLSEQQLETIRLLYPMGIGTGKAREYLIRIPVDILADGSILCQGESPSGSPAHLMITDKDECRANMHEAAIDIRDQLFGKQPKVVFVFESLMRRKVLGHGITQELHTLRDVLGQTTTIFGMYTLGEIAPLGSLKNVATTQLLNGSLVLLAIG